MDKTLAELLEGFRGHVDSYLEAHRGIVQLIGPRWNRRLPQGCRPLLCNRMAAFDKARKAVLSLGEQLADALETKGLDSAELRRLLAFVGGDDDGPADVRRVWPRVLSSLGRMVKPLAPEPKGRKPGRPKGSGDTSRTRDSEIYREWKRGFNKGEYKSKADFAAKLPEKTKRMIPPGKDRMAYVKRAIDRARKRAPRRSK